MAENNPKNGGENEEPRITVNDFGATKDPAVVVEEKDRTVLLTDRETIVIPKSDAPQVPPRRERRIYAGMWGPVELAAVGASLLALLATILLFVFLVFPAKRELANNRANLADLDKKLSDANSRFGSITNTQDRVAELARSTDDFQARFLSPRASGEAALYQQINGLITAYGLVNTAGPDYLPLEVNETGRQNQDGQEGKGRARLVSFYPGTYVTMTLEGSYTSLRRFIRELETSNQFIVISTIELEPSENTQKDKVDPTKPPPPTPVQPVAQPGFGGAVAINQDGAEPVAKVDRGKTRGEIVTLRIELAAYFRRPDFASLPASAEPQPRK